MKAKCATNTVICAYIWHYTRNNVGAH